MTAVPPSPASMGRRPNVAPGGPPAAEPDVAQPSMPDHFDAVRAAFDLQIEPDIDLAAATASLVAAHDVLQRRLSDLSN